MRRRCTMLAAAAMFASTLVLAPVAAAAPHTEDVPPPSKRVYVVTDSVGLGARSAIPAAFPGDWQVTVDGTPALFVEQLLSKHVQPREASQPWVLGDYAVVAGGYNYPYWDPARFDRSIDAMVDNLVAHGVRHVFWVTLREVKPQYISAGAWRQVQPYFWYFPTVNDHLRAALSRHPQLSLIDWAAIADRPGVTYDAIHLNGFGAQLYAGDIADAVLTADTRLPAGHVAEIPVAGVGGVPADAKAVALNLTVHNPRTAGYFTAYPCDGPRPLVSNLNFLPGQIVAATAVVPVGANGKVCVFQFGDANLIVDVTGSFGASSGLVPVWPNRAIDTRETPSRVGASPTVVHVGATPGLPADRSSAVVHLTTIGGAQGGTLNLYPCDAGPSAVPTRSIVAGKIQNLLLITALDGNGDVCLTASSPTDAIVDVFAGFAAGADVHPLPVTRVFDSGGNQPGGAVSVIQVLGQPGVPVLPTGAMLSVNATGAESAGFVSAFPCATGRQNTSMMNTTPNHEQGNSTLVAVDGNGQACLYQLFPGRLTVDLTGWTGTAFTPLTPARLFDSREL